MGSGGGFPAMAGNVPFLMKDVVLLAASIYLLKQDVTRVALSARHGAAASRLRIKSNRSNRFRLITAQFFHGRGPAN